MPIPKATRMRSTTETITVWALDTASAPTMFKMVSTTTTRLAKMFTQIPAASSPKKRLVA